MVLHEINWLDPSIWLWGAVIIVIVTFISVYLRILLGKKEP